MTLSCLVQRSADEKEQQGLRDRFAGKLRILDDHVKNQIAMPGMTETLASKAWEDSSKLQQ